MGVEFGIHQFLFRIISYEVHVCVEWHRLRSRVKCLMRDGVGWSYSLFFIKSLLITVVRSEISGLIINLKSSRNEVSCLKK
jgi:hypothetical protein